MNTTVFMLTLREFVGQKRSLVLLLLAIVPVFLALIYGLGDQVDQQDWTANFLMDGIVTTLVLPLSCLILGTAAIGSEIEDGTALYILAKPIKRAEIVLAKFAGAVLPVAAVLIPATVISGLIAISGTPENGIVVGFAVAVTLGVLAYTALFLLLSIMTTRALLIGLAYVFIWEGLLTSLFGGTAYLSVRQYCLGTADVISGARPRDFEADLGVEALFLGAAVVIIALLYATRRLETIELSQAE